MYLLLSMTGSEEEKERFEILYRNYRQWMWRIAMGILHDEGLAEDAVQEAFLSAIRHMDRFADPFDLSSKRFLGTIVKNRALDIWRRRSRQEEPVEKLPEVSGADLLDRYLEKASLEEIVEAIRSLDEKYRVVLEYRYLHQCSDREMQELLGLSRNLLHVRLSRARGKLRRSLEKIGVGGEPE